MSSVVVGTLTVGAVREEEETGASLLMVVGASLLMAVAAVSVVGGSVEVEAAGAGFEEVTSPADWGVEVPIVGILLHEVSHRVSME